MIQDPFDQLTGFQSIGTKLTPEEVQVALSFLRRRFPRMPVRKIISNLDRYHQKKQEGLPQSSRPQTVTQRRVPVQNTAKSNQWLFSQKGNQSAQEKKLREHQNLRLVAQEFCEGGEDYLKAKAFVPQLDQPSYRRMLISIMNTTIKQLINFLKKECGNSIKELTQAQKISIKTAMINAHRWMGLKGNQGIEALDTLLKFIARKFLNRHKMITKSQAVNLYSVIAKRINDKSLDLTSLQPEKDEFGEQIIRTIAPSTSFPIQDLSELLKIIGTTFLDVHDIEKTSHFLMQKYGPSKIWEVSEIQKKLSQIVREGLRKLQSYKRRGVVNTKFTISDNLIKQIQTHEYFNMQYALVQLYLSKMQEKSIIYSLMSDVHSLSNKVSHAEMNSEVNQEQSQYFDQQNIQNDVSGSPRFQDVRVSEQESMQVNPTSVSQDNFEQYQKQWQQGQNMLMVEGDSMKEEEIDREMIYFGDDDKQQ